MFNLLLGVGAVVVRDSNRSNNDVVNIANAVLATVFVQSLRDFYTPSN